jgi:hypothetical protein
MKCGSIFLVLLVLAAADDDSNYASLSGTLDDGISG